MTKIFCDICKEEAFCYILPSHFLPVADAERRLLISVTLTHENYLSGFTICETCHRAIIKIIQDKVRELWKGE